MFSLPIDCENLDYCCTNDDETKVINVSKGVLKDIRFFPTGKIKYFVPNKIDRNNV